MDRQQSNSKKKPILKRAGYHLFSLSKRLTNKAIFNEPFTDRNYTPLKSKYDNYGFSLDDNQFASGIEEYEKEFEVKKERRLKRWESVPISERLYNIESDEFKLLVRKGIPDHLRPLLWRKLLGADTLEESNPGLYQRMLDMPLAKEISDQIDMDINRTFPHHRNYKVNSFGTMMLRNVLSAFACYMPSISYCQSLNYLTATLLIFMNEEEAFWCLVQIVNSRVHQKGFNLTGLCYIKMKIRKNELIDGNLGYYKDGMIDLKRDVLVLEFILRKRMRRLYNHLKKNNIDLMWICAEWFLCLFAISLPVGLTCNSNNIDSNSTSNNISSTRNNISGIRNTSNNNHVQITTVFRVWDSLFLEGDKILFRVAFSLFKLHEQKLLTLDSDKDLLLYCKSMSKSVLQHDEFLKIAFYQLSSFSRKEIHQYRLYADHELEVFSLGP
ncbi:uncharacterized protein TOT_010000327 [Theileria orientalis strain Shintoku]|uniref:Rab-GAP TBC domain-containing protein n=1 Tax=Theileria orientalis strain Shintoku TaxID=869250 RepID=J4D5C5_THEOR|nr:uncharacterized protein TOT_010000327 [Theileria orientalis strain Shintoku]BAM38860.1 uncharacterized protein TOT_010000327 [Theileria orientalis strain Shintoku]|eukprot:XP_009689161.1 uncharacterized protein TOT_010000327 [Theileria orientalis strain Shintoku]